MSVHIAVIIPARNEAGNIETLVAELRRTPAHTIIVVDNGSTDSTAAEALVAGAMVVSEPRPGYGHACAAGTRAATDVGADIVVFIDGDHSCRPDEMMRLVQPILDGPSRTVNVAPSRNAA